MVIRAAFVLAVLLALVFGACVGVPATHHHSASDHALPAAPPCCAAVAELPARSIVPAAAVILPVVWPVAAELARNGLTLIPEPPPPKSLA